MKQWEYFTFVIKSEGDHINLSSDALYDGVSLNMLGKQGWEAVSVTYVPLNKPITYIILLKREIQCTVAEVAEKMLKK